MGSVAPVMRTAEAGGIFDFCASAAATRSSGPETGAPGEEKTKNVRRPVVFQKPIADLKEPPLPPPPIAPSSLSMFELDDMICEDDAGSEPLAAQQFMPAKEAKVEPHWHRAARVWPAMLATIAFFVLTSFHAWQPAPAEAPELPASEPVIADVADVVAPPPPVGEEPPDDAKKASPAKKKRSKRR